MKINSVKGIREEFENVQVEMVQLSKNMVKGVDRQESLARLNELHAVSNGLSDKLESIGDEEVGTLATDLDIQESSFNVESTLGNAIGIVDILLRRIIDLYNNANDIDKTEIASQISGVESINEISNMKAVSGRGVRLTDDKIIEIRDAFKSAWYENPYIKLPEFMRQHEINMQAYSLASLIKGKTYTDVGGPIRGTDYDTEETNHIISRIIEEEG